MGRFLQLAWWPFGSWRRRSADAGVRDFADMGTAFGLDESLAPDSSLIGGETTIPAAHELPPRKRSDH